VTAVTFLSDGTHLNRAEVARRLIRNARTTDHPQATIRTTAGDAFDPYDRGFQFREA